MTVTHLSAAVVASFVAVALASGLAGGSAQAQNVTLGTVQLGTVQVQGQHQVADGAGEPAAPQIAYGPLPSDSAPGIMGGLPKIIDEVRIGGLAHDVGFLGDSIEPGADANIEILFTSPDFLEIIDSPRPHIGGDINTSGATSDGYFGLTWSYTFLHDILGSGIDMFGNGSLGGALQDGFIDSAAPKDRKQMGSRILFRESLEPGLQLTPVFSVSAFLEHISNANLGHHNAGITSAGGRFGFKF